MKILVDMNLSPDWVKVLEEEGHVAAHWSSIGDVRAADFVLMDWARSNGYIVFTHDLDFGTLLALTQAESPSVIQVRTQDVTPNHLAKIVLAALSNHVAPLDAGALIVLDESRARVRILPLSRRP